MTIEQFANRSGKKIEIVLKWIYDGLIPQASVDNDFVPDSARVPYRSNAKNSDSIYESIVRASSNAKHVCAKTYGLCDQEFQGYIERLVDAGLIVKRTTDNVTYFDATIAAGDIKRKRILDAIKAISFGVSLGVSTALLNA